MTTLFISDLHLTEERPDITNTFLNFLNTEAQQATALYVLGDFFDMWIGDDYDTPFNKSMIDALKALTAKGVTLSFQHGNRDFLLGKDFAKATGATLLPERHVIDLYGTPTLLMHGDLLCTEDTDYLAMRAQTHNKMMQKMFLFKSIQGRLEMVQSIREQVKEKSSMKPEGIMDVTESAVLEEIKNAKAKLLIHGHTHRPATHQYQIDNEPVERIVLGCWEETPMILVSDGAHRELKSLSLN